VTVVTRSHTVNMTDVDLVQVNFSRFFPWMDDAYNALLRELAHPLSGIIQAGFATPVVDARCSYQRPVGLDQEFVVRSAVVGHGRSSYTVAHRFEDDRGIFALGSTKHVWIATRPTQSPAPVPEWISGAVVWGFMEEDS